MTQLYIAGGVSSQRCYEAIETADMPDVFAAIYTLDALSQMLLGFADQRHHVSRYVLSHCWRVLPGLAVFTNE